MKVSDYIAERLRTLGARHVFMVTGGGAMHLNDAFARVVPYRVIYNHHEQACAIGAEGLYRATGQVGVVNVTTGPGGLNALTGVMGQWTDGIPAFYVSGQVKRSTTLASCRDLPLRQLGDQEVDIIPVVRSLTKYAVSLQDPKQVRVEVERAWHLATTGRMGPVWLDVPMDVQGALVDPEALEPYVPTEETLPAPVDPAQVVAWLRAAERPVIVAGHGIRLAGALPAFRRLVDHLGVPVVTSHNGFDLLPDAHPCYAGRIGTIGTRGGNFTLQNADVVLELGTRNNIRQVSYNWENFASKAVTIAVDIDAAELRKPTFAPTHPIQADLRTYLPALADAVEGGGTPPDREAWRAWARARTERNPVVRPEHLKPSERLQPYPFFDRFTKALPEGATVVAGNGTACVVLFQAGVVREGQRMFWNSGCASMGYDLPAAIGAAVGGVSPVWCIAGDGSLQMNLQELATVAFLRLPIKLVYLENGGYASIRQTQTNFFGGQYGCGGQSGPGFPDMEKLAAAYGIPYHRSTTLEGIAADVARVEAVDGPVIWEVPLKLDYSFEPKLSSEKLPDGRIVSKPLEDMFPFLPRDEFAENMRVPGRDGGDDG